MVTIFARILLTATYTAGIAPRSLQNRNERLNAAKVSNMTTLSFIWATAAISAVCIKIIRSSKKNIKRSYLMAAPAKKDPISNLSLME